jgi:hypothetical protein
LGLNKLKCYGLNELGGLLFPGFYQQKQGQEAFPNEEYKALIIQG